MLHRRYFIKEHENHHVFDFRRTWALQFVRLVTRVTADGASRENK